MHLDRAKVVGVKIGDLVASAVALGLAVAPIPAAAGEVLRGRAIPAAMSPTTAKLRTIMSSLTQVPGAGPGVVQVPETGPVVAPPPEDDWAVALPPSAPRVVARTVAPPGTEVAPWRPSKRASPPPLKGTGMMITGGALVGGGLLLTGVMALLLGADWCMSHDEDRCEQASEDKSGYTALVFPGVIVVIGIALLTVGSHREVKWHNWKRRRAVMPTAGRNPGGAWTAGITLRF